ncbi:MAG: GTPase ObgE, partial [Pseudomonadota bacterium]
MRFIDEVTITVCSGKGGDGCIGFRREKYVPFGGPNGGDGGDGGDVYVEADENFNTLLHFRGQRLYQAQEGEDGMGKDASGKTGKDLILRVPVGTIIRQAETRIVVADLTHHGERLLLAKGGRGGQGNMNFATSTNQAPRYAEDGGAAEVLELELELKLLADVALIGQPNAGKSTLISVISAARPKIADYPFTTLEPNLGVAYIDEQSFVVADIPGLIENASEGKGLGTKFLKHIERTSVFVHLVDATLCLEEYEAYEMYTTVREELGKFNSQLLKKKEIVCLTKTDAMSEEEITKISKFFEEQLDRKILAISAVSGKNIDLLKRVMLKAIKAEKESIALSELNPV